MAASVVVTLFAIFIAGLWRVFEKANKPGWAVLVPVYNVICLLKIAGESGWLVLILLFFPLNVYIYMAVSIAIAKAFNKGALFGLGLAVIGVVFYPILGFGRAIHCGKTEGHGFLPIMTDGKA